MLLLVLLFLAGTRGLLARQTPHETKIASLTQPVAPSNGRPQAVVVKGIVTGLSGWKNSFFLQDKSGSISVDRTDETPVVPGDMVIVSGSVGQGLFAPVLVTQSVTVVGKSRLPQPATPTYEQLADGSFDSRFIEISGVVRSAQVTTMWGRPILLVSLQMPGGSISLHVLDYAHLQPEAMVDSTITARGVCGTKFNDRKQIIGLRLFVAGPADLKIQAAPPNVSNIPTSAIPLVQRYSPGSQSQHRVKVAGTLTYQSGEEGIYLEQDGFAIHVRTNQSSTFQLGDRLEALGFTWSDGYSPGLHDAQLRVVSHGSQVQPLAAQPGDILIEKDGFGASQFDGRLVQLTAEVVEQLPNSRDQLWLLRRGKLLFQAELSGSPNAVSLEPKSEVSVVGVCVIEVDESGQPTAFRLLLRSPGDIAVMRSPSWKQSVFALVAGLALLMIAALLIWVFDLRYAQYVAGGFGAADPGRRAFKFRITSLNLARLVFAAGVVSLIIPGAVIARFEPLFGSAMLRGALTIAAIAMGWNHNRARYKGVCSVVLAATVMLIGAVSLSQYQAPLVGNAGITVAIALCLLVFGGSMLLLHFRKFVTGAQLLCIAVASLSALNLITRLLGASTNYGIARHTAMPLFTAVCFFMLSATALTSTADLGLMGPISSSGRGGLMSRRLLPAALLVPLLFGWVRLQGQTLGLYDTVFGIALVALANCLFFGGIVWVSSAVLNRLDLARMVAEAVLRERDQQLELIFTESGIGDYTWDIRKGEVHAHPVIWQLYGAGTSQVSAPMDWFQSRIHPDDQSNVEEAIRISIEGRTPLDVEFRAVHPNGDVRWISSRGNAVYDDNGQPTFLNGINIDVTDRKEAEIALQRTTEKARESDRQFQIGLEFAKMAAWSWIAARDEITWTGPVEEITGRAAAELGAHEQIECLVYAEDLARVKAALASTLEHGLNFGTEFRIHTDKNCGDSSNIRWVTARGGALKDNDGTVYGMSGVIFDITATKTAEQRLLQSERSFRELADAMPQIVWIANAEGVIEYYNQRWYAYTGSAIGQDISLFVHPDDIGHAEQMWRESLATGTPFTCERRIKRAEDNTFRWHLSRALPILDASGIVSRWFGTSTYIDDYKCAQAEIQSLNGDLQLRVAELAEKELDYRLLFESVKDYAMFMLDPLGLVKSWNAGAEYVTGYRSAEILGKYISVFHTPESINAGLPETVLQYCLADGRFYEEGWRVRRDGGQFWANVVVTRLLDSEGRLLGFSTIIRDLTEQRRAMSLLVAERQRAELANQAKSNFLASMSHEIRTPMNAILGMADLLSETPLNATQKEYVGRFQRAGSDLLAIINDILDLSRIESGNFDLEEVPFDLEEVAQRSLDMVAPKAQRNHVNIAFRLVPDFRTKFIGDPSRLQQILLNLLGNATKFTQKGEIVLTIRPHPDGAPNHVQFKVSDTGIGIPSDKLSCIFEDFTQAESSTTRRFGGTGLGLGIAQRLVRRMGGALIVESELGVGSTFTFDTVFQEAPDSLFDSRPLPSSDDLSLVRILIVDTIYTNRLIYREMCSVWNMRPDVTSSAEEAVSLLAQSIQEMDPFSVVVLDRYSADWDAFKACDEIRGLGSDVPVILTTADDIPGEATRAITCGFAGYIIKPIRRTSFRNAILSATHAASWKTTEQTAVSQIPSAKTETQDKIKLLVADDSEDNQFLIEEYLKDSPYEIEFAVNGEQAVQSFKQRQFDMILMDIQMPVLDGLQATATIRALERAVGSKPPIPILALTANAMAEDIEKSRSAGCNAHVAKPVSKASLLKALEQWYSAPVTSAQSTKGSYPQRASETTHPKPG